MTVKDRVIEIGGARRSGKDTVANMLVNKISKSRRISFAEPMKDIIADMLDVSIEKLEELKNIEGSKERGYLQRFGQKNKEYFGAECWLNIAKHTVANLPKGSTSIISDFRMPVEYIEGALTIQVVNPNISNSDAHISERALDDFEFDVVIVNDGTLKDLEDKVDKLVKRLYKSEWIM